jgi:hypothetical protein
MGFSPADFLEIGLAIFLAALAWVSRPWLEPWAERLAKRVGWSMLVLAILPIALRLALLPHHPVPYPENFDEHGHLLVADTLRYFRLSNPAHPMQRFFETLYVIQEPRYASVYPIGQGLALLIGRTIFGSAWAGVLLSGAAFCSLTYWMLRAWAPPVWALLGGLLAVIEFGPLCAWTNTFSGGFVAACAGCLILGAARRRMTRANAVVLAAGLMLAALTMYSPNARYSRERYGVPPPLTISNYPEPAGPLTPQQELEYRAQLSYRERGGETVRSYLLRLEYRVRFYRFFFLPALYLALPFLVTSLRERALALAAAGGLLLALAVNFIGEFQLTELALASGLFILMSMAGLQRLARIRREAAWVVLALCAAHFTLWYAVHLFDQAGPSQGLMGFETWDAINHAPGRHAGVAAAIGDQGRHLVFVRYRPGHAFRDEWVYNSAEIDSARIVWARDLSDAENRELVGRYPDRTVWRLDPDARPPDLQPYSP